MRPFLSFRLASRMTAVWSARRRISRATTKKPRPYSPAFSASMAALIDSKLVWSATLVIVVITITGYLVCLLLAELSAMMPDRSGGLPSYAYPAYKEKWPRFAEHVLGKDFTRPALL